MILVASESVRDFSRGEFSSTSMCFIQYSTQFAPFLMMDSCLVLNIFAHGCATNERLFVHSTSRWDL